MVGFVFEQSGAPFPARGLIILVTRRPNSGPFLNCAGYNPNGFGSPFQQVNLQVLQSLVASGCQLEMLQWIHGFEKFMFHEPGMSIQRLDSIFAKKVVLVLGRLEPNFGSIGAISLLLFHFIMKEIKGEDYFPQNYMYVVRSTTHHMESFIDFHFHFLAHFQT